MDLFEILDVETFAFDMEEEPPVPIPDNLGDPAVHASYKETAVGHEARRQERVKKRKGEEQALKEAVGKVTVASKAIVVRRKTAN